MKQGVEQGGVNPPLEEKTAKNILFSSFYFSQGSKYLQHDIFRYLHRLRPNWHMDYAFPWQLIQDEKFQEKAYGVVLSNGEKHPTHFRTGQPINIDDAQSNLLEEAHALVRHLNGEIEDMESDDNLLATLTWEVIGQDQEHLIEKGGRPRGAKNAISQTDSLSPYEDPYLSHFCYYILARNKTGIDEFDSIFADIRRKWSLSLSIAAPEQRPRILENLRQIIEVYNAHHANSKVLAPEIGSEV